MSTTFYLYVCLILITAIQVQSDLLTLNENFNDPFKSDPTDAMLDIDVQTTCPQNIQITVTIVGDGVSSPQFNGPDFGPLTLAGDGPTGADVHFHKITSSITEFIFTNFQHVVQAKDANNIDIPGYYNFYVLIPVTELVGLGVTVTGAISIVGPLNKNFFVATQTSEICKGPGLTQDPMFVGFQGQEFQFHGLADEHFNLISTPSMQVNSHFVYLANGQCNYNDSLCWTHPGTYVDVLGFILGDTRIKIQSGTHEIGLRVWLMNNEITPSPRSIIFALHNSSTDTATIIFTKRNQIKIITPLLMFDITNSDYFMNIGASLSDHELLRAGSRSRFVTQHELCKSQTTHDYQLIEQTVSKLYPVRTPLHGLVGQTWRNVKVCGRDWMGVVEDYLVSDLFGTEYHYNYFTQH